MNRIIITTPVYRSEDAIVTECRATVNALRDAGLAMAEWLIQPGPLVFDNRNRLVRHALTFDGWTHMLCLDADVSLPDPATDIGRLLARGVDIVGGAYQMRYEGGPHVICAARLDRGHVAPTSTGIHSVDWVGGGCLLLSRRAIDRLGPLWFRHEFNATRTDQTPEDVGFCQHARANGYMIWLDCDVKATHHQLTW